MSKLNWSKVERKYGSYLSGECGDIKLFKIAYDGMVSKGDDEPERLTSFLPGHELSMTWYSNVDKAKEAAEKIFKSWLDHAGLTTVNTCTWLNNEDYGFMSECGNSFHNDDGTIDWMNYCPFCGGKVVCNG